MTVELPSGEDELHKLVIGGNEAGLGTLGVIRPGTTRQLQLCSPTDPGLPYVLLASLSTSPGLGTCAGVLPLTPDALFLLSLDPASPVFQNFQGSLDSSGSTSAPALALPNNPALSGQSFFLAFLTLDLGQISCPVSTICLLYTSPSPRD